MQQGLRAAEQAVAELGKLPEPGMRDRDQRRQLERAAGAIDPSGIGRRRVPQYRLVASRARGIRVIGGQIGSIQQNADSNTRPCRVQAAGDVAPVDQCKPAAQAARPVALHERLRLDMRRQVVPGRKAIFPGDAGLCVVQTECARDDVVGAQVPGGRQCAPEPRDRIRIATPVGAKQILCLLFQVNGIRPIG